MEKPKDVLFLHDSGQGPQWIAITGVYGTRRQIIFKTDRTILPVPDETSVLINYRLIPSRIARLQDESKCKTLSSLRGLIFKPRHSSKPIWADHTVEFPSE